MGFVTGMVAGTVIAGSSCGGGHSQAQGGMVASDSFDVISCIKTTQHNSNAEFCLGRVSTLSPEEYAKANGYVRIVRKATDPSGKIIFMEVSR